MSSSEFHPVSVYAETDYYMAGRLTAYTFESAREIGAMMPQLDAGFSGEPTPQARLERIIASPDMAQLVVVDKQRLAIVGAATVGLVMGAGFGERGQLEDVIVDETARGRQPGQEQNAAGVLWDSITGWHALVGLQMIGFDSEVGVREEARKFYKNKGAYVPDPTGAPSHFHYDLTIEDIERVAGKER